MTILLIRLDAESLSGALEAFGWCTFNSLRRPDFFDDPGLVMSGHISELQGDVFHVLRYGLSVPPSSLGFPNLVLAKSAVVCSGSDLR